MCIYIYFFFLEHVNSLLFQEFQVINVDQRFLNFLDAGLNSQPYQHPRAGKAAVTYNGEGRSDVTTVCV